ncbi:unnamed protein product [Cladocopium goreaui]|uniref:Calmodulin-4 n=1 Tax=Cladocopium goreaui TaxID=2562237 RepID=A0A9P1BHN9_9DINO|nr:unnamed protein product [Cladocopium goreaui]
MSPYGPYSAREHGSWSRGWGWGFSPNEATWRYVGESKGHDMIVCCFGVVSAMFFIIALVWWKAGGALPALPTWFASGNIKPLHNCHVGYDDWQKTWDYRKQLWCCSNYGRGCPSWTLPRGNDFQPFDCSAGFSHWKSGWSEDKKIWCCRNQGRCAEYNCDHGQASWHLDWTAHKKAWCCLHTGVGCATTTTTDPVQDPVDFDCSVGVHSERQSHWSKAKKEWCCHHYHRGCDYDCSASPLWQSEWSHNQKAWCCQHKGKGCPGFVAPRFDCGEGAYQGWHQEKKDWCCKHEHVGCASHESYDCSHGFENWRHAWDDEKKSWCCRHHRCGCEHDCSGIENWKTHWSSSQKTWCCDHVGVGCERTRHGLHDL